MLTDADRGVEGAEKMIRLVFDPRFISAHAALFWGYLTAVALLIAAAFILAYRRLKR